MRKLLLDALKLVPTKLLAVQYLIRTLRLKPHYCYNYGSFHCRGLAFKKGDITVAAPCEDQQWQPFFVIQDTISSTDKSVHLHLMYLSRCMSEKQLIAAPDFTE